MTSDRKRMIFDNTKGENNRNSLLNQAKADEIRKLHAGGMTLKALSEKFGVSKSNICNIVKNRIWSWQSQLVIHKGRVG